MEANINKDFEKPNLLRNFLRFHFLTGTNIKQKIEKPNFRQRKMLKVKES